MSTHGFIPSLTSHKCGGMARSPWSGSSDRDVHTSLFVPGDLKTTYCAKPPTSPEVGLPLKGLCWVYLILHFDLPLFILLADSSCFEAWQPRNQMRLGDGQQSPNGFICHMQPFIISTFPWNLTVLHSQLVDSQFFCSFFFSPTYSQLKSGFTWHTALSLNPPMVIFPHPNGRKWLFPCFFPMFSTHVVLIISPVGQRQEVAIKEMRCGHGAGILPDASLQRAIYEVKAGAMNFFLLYHNVNICMYVYIYMFTHITHITHITYITYIYIHIHTYTYIYIHTHTYTYIHTHTYIYIHIHTYTYIYIHIHTYTYIYIHIHTLYIHIHTYTYIYIHIHTYTYIHAYIHTYIYIHTYTYIYIHIHIHTYTYIYIHIHTYTYIYIHIHTYTYIYIHLHTYTYIYIHIHTYTYIYIHIHTYTYIYIHIHPGGLFIELAFSTFAVFVIWFYTTNHSGFASLSKFNFLKSTRVLFTGYVKNLSGTLFFLR